MSSNLSVSVLSVLNVSNFNGAAIKALRPKNAKSSKAAIQRALNCEAGNRRRKEAAKLRKLIVGLATHINSQRLS